MEPTLKHTAVGSVCDGKDVRRHFVSPLAFVKLDYFFCVDGKTFVGIDDDTEQTRVRLKVHQLHRKTQIRLNYVELYNCRVLSLLTVARM